MNKYFNKILFSLFVLSFFIIPIKTFASTSFSITPSGTNRNFTCPNPPDDGSTGTRAVYQDDGDDLPGAYSIFVLNFNSDNCATRFGGGENWLPYNSAIGTDAFEYRRNVSGTDDYVSLPFYTVSGVVFSSGSSVISEITSRITPSDSSTVPYNVEFEGTYNNVDTFDGLILWVQDTSTSQIFTHAYSIPLTNGEDLPFYFVYPLSPNREYTYKLRLYDSSDTSYTDWTSDYTFNTSSLASEIPAWEPETCDSIITDFGSCVRNFMRETFYPSPESLSQFQSLTLRNSVPFSYVYDMGNLYYELFDTESTQSMTVGVTTPIGNITFISADMISAIPLSGTIKNILGWLIYMFTAFYIYRLILVRTHS